MAKSVNEAKAEAWDELGLCEVNMKALVEGLDELLDENGKLDPDDQLDENKYDAVDGVLAKLRGYSLCDCCGERMAVRQDYRQGDGGEQANTSKYHVCDECSELNDVAFFDAMRNK